MTSNTPDTQTRPFTDVLHEDNQQKVGRIARSTLLLVIAFAVAKVISLAQTFIIADAFGLGAEYDAFSTANRIPEQLVRLLAGGALGYAFIPVFSGFIAKGEHQRGWEVASRVMSFIVIVSGVLSALAYFAAPWLIGTLLAPGFSPETAAQSVSLMRVLLISTMIFVMSTIITDTLEGYHHFLSPALAPIMLDVGILIGVLFLLEPFGIMGVAWGSVIGATLHLLVQVPAQIYYKARWRLTLNFKDPVFWTVMLLMLPRVAGIFVANIDRIISNNLASQLGEGAVSAYNWGWQLTQIPQTLLGTTLGIVMFPTLAALAEAGESARKQAAMNSALKFLLITTIPSAVGLVLVGRPLISLLEGGAFDANATEFVYSTLQYFSLTIIFFSLLELSVRGFYADKDTLTPLWISLGGMTIHAVVAVSFSGIWFGKDTALDLGVGGLALAVSLGMIFEVCVLLLVLRKRWQWSIVQDLGATLGKTLIASVVMGLAVVLVGWLWEQAGLSGQGRLLTIVQVGGMVLAGIVAFAGMAYALRIREIGDLINILLRRKNAADVLQEATL